MEQFAKAIAVAALSGDDRAAAERLAAKLGYGAEYWRQFPKSETEIEPRYRELRDRLNAAANGRSEAWRELQKHIAKP
jgi:hypothetical protein